LCFCIFLSYDYFFNSLILIVFKILNNFFNYPYTNLNFYIFLIFFTFFKLLIYMIICKLWFIWFYIFMNCSSKLKLTKMFSDANSKSLCKTKLKDYFELNAFLKNLRTLNFNDFFKLFLLKSFHVRFFMILKTGNNFLFNTFFHKIPICFFFND